jgi:hypothetical protein
MQFLKMPVPVKDPMNLTWGIQFRNIDPVQAKIIFNVVTNCWMDSVDYIKKHKTNSFMQGYDYTEQGKWVYVEFLMELTQGTIEFIAYLESQVNDEQRYNETKEYMTLAEEL